MFRKSRRQQKNNNKRKRYTKKSHKTIKGAGISGFIKSAIDKVAGDTIFGKTTIRAIRKQYNDPDKHRYNNKNTFIAILYDVYNIDIYGKHILDDVDMRKRINDTMIELITNVCKNYEDDPTILKIQNNTVRNKSNMAQLDKYEFEHVLRLVKKEYDANKKKYDDKFKGKTEAKTPETPYHTINNQDPV